MSNLSRREILKLAIAGAGGLALFPSDRLFASPRLEDDPHFYLQIILQGGADNSYLFDARPLAMTKAGKIQNYIGQEPEPWTGVNGGTCLATSLVAPLKPFRERFSIVNGVVVSPSFDGHDQNMNLLFTGNDFGGESFVPHLNADETGARPASLDAITNGFLLANLTNLGACVPLSPTSADKLRIKLKELSPASPTDKLVGFIRSRLEANSSGPGRFAAGSRLMFSGLDRSPELHLKLRQLQPIREGGTPERQFCELFADSFRLGIARSAVWVLEMRSGFLDTHSPDQAKTQPQMFKEIAEQLASIFKYLAETPYDSKRSFMDVTTVMVTSEFSRTMRIPGSPIEKTGTNHNSLNNTVLIGGKGIRGDQIIGASDFQSAEEKLSTAHLALDPQAIKMMGRPFDFKTMKPRSDLPASFNPADYLTINSVVNTIYRAFGNSAGRYHTLGRDLPPAPILEGLLA